MKKIKTLVIALLTVGSMMAFNSCSDKCKDVTCQNGGSCNKDDGSCECATGYEGTNCETAIRTKFIGTYRGSEQCTVGSDNYDIEVVAGSGILNIKINNTYNQNFTSIATVSGSSFTVESQTVAAGVTLSGNGSVSGDNITFTYTISDGGVSNSCTFTGTRI